jgi:hypothetical protein
LNGWAKQGVEITYLSAHKNILDVRADEAVLQRYCFPHGPIYFRQGAQGYQEVAERVMPDVLIEDDCESIGGEVEMTYPHLRPETKAKIKSIVIKEFGGIDGLPDELDNLVHL